VPNAATAMALASMRTLLTGLGDLALDVHCGWGMHEYTCCWQELGRFTGLTALYIEFDKQVGAAGLLCSAWVWTKSDGGWLLAMVVTRTAWRPAQRAAGIARHVLHVPNGCAWDCHKGGVCWTA